MDEVKPFVCSDAFGVTVGHPRQELLKMAGGGVNVYLLQDRECVWSSWLVRLQVCERYEPWLTNTIEHAATIQRVVERARYAQWYGSEQDHFNRFLRKVFSP